MGRYCCVPKCNSNAHGANYITCFRFPKDEELKRKWMKNIPRKNFVPNKDSVVCIRHFEDESVIFTDKIISKDGKVSEYSRRYPKLKDDAFSKLFPNLPKLIQKRNGTIERKNTIENYTTMI